MDAINAECFSANLWGMDCRCLIILHKLIDESLQHGRRMQKACLETNLISKMIEHTP
jgi:hypothetical protein